MRGFDLSKDHSQGHVDIPKLRAGHVDAVFFALYTSASLAPDAATRRALEMAASVFDAVGRNSEDLALATSPGEILSNRASGKISILLGMENGAPIQRSLSLLRLFHRLGVRYMTLTHNGDNEIADCAAVGTRWGGLSPFGREVVAEMNDLGMMIDVAHVSDRTFFDCIAASRAPILSTHSCCRALAGHPRNMTDEMLRILADHGGVIQINFYPVFLSDAYGAALAARGLDPDDETVSEQVFAIPRPSFRAVADHIDHAVRVAGVESVGIGSDFDGIGVAPEGLENASKMPVLFDELRRRGYTESQLEKIAGGNFLRVFNDVISSRLCK